MTILQTARLIQKRSNKRKTSLYRIPFAKQLLHRVYSTSLQSSPSSPTLKSTSSSNCNRLSVFGLDEVGHGLGLGLVVVSSIRAVVNVVVVVVVVAVLGADVLHLVDGTALGATLDGAVAGGSEPDDNVRVGRVAGAAKVLLVTEGLDGDGVVERACVLLAQLFPSHVGSEPRIVPGGALKRLLQTAHVSSGTNTRGRLLSTKVYVPFLLASRGLMSKISTPCIFPRISRRSRPVACSRSVGMVPG